MSAHDARVMASSENPNWRTDPLLIAALTAMTGPMDVDLAALACNTLAPIYFGPDSPFILNTLEASTADILRLGRALGATRFWLNPPYSRTLKMPIEPWFKLSFEIGMLFADYIPGARLYLLVPYSPQTDHWRTYVEGHHPANYGASHIRIFPHRLSFVHEDGHQRANANVNHALVEYSSPQGYVGPWSVHRRYWTYRRTA